MYTRRSLVRVRVACTRHIGVRSEIRLVRCIMAQQQAQQPQEPQHPALVRALVSVPDNLLDGACEIWLKRFGLCAAVNGWEPAKKLAYTFRLFCEEKRLLYSRGSLTTNDRPSTLWRRR